MTTYVHRNATFAGFVTHKFRRLGSAGRLLLLCPLALASALAQANDGSVLPFPPTPTASVAGPSLQESTMVRRKVPSRLPAGAPNIVIILLDDVGFGLADTFGGPVRTPTLSRLARTGISYNTFHTTSICSPTRAALLTGRNHHRVGSGTIADRAMDWDGYTGVIPRTAATLPKILGNYGYKTAAFGKWHNTPTADTTAMGPFTLWPTGEGIGFDYFYGFMAFETSQWEPRLYENRNPIEPPKHPSYHLSEDLAERAVDWIRKHEALTPDKPFMMYWAPGAAHGPHQIFKEWADRYRGRFDGGWDALRTEIFQRQKQLGWIPAHTQLTPRAESMASWESIPSSERAFQTRLMEVFAGFAEHVDVQAGKIIDELERLGIRDNTLVFYIWGDNGSSAEGLNGSVSELLAQNGLSSTVPQHIAALNSLGGLEALGGRKVDNMYHAGWAWAGNTPMRHTKLVASHFGGTRNPLVVSWPRNIAPDRAPRPQFHHVNDVTPTILDLLKIPPPAIVDGYPQDPMDGVSMAYSFASAREPGRKRVQYFENNGSRGIYQDGWYACTFGPLTPWQVSSPAQLVAWDSRRDVWELYNLTNDFSQANNLAAQEPGRLEAMKRLFLEVAEVNKAFPIGGGLWTRIDPLDGPTAPGTSWNWKSALSRMPERTAPALGRQSNHVRMEVDVPAGASGVLYALGGASGGVSLFLENGYLNYEYNLFIIERYRGRSSQPLPAGRHVIEVDTRVGQVRGPATVVISVDGVVVATVAVARTSPGAFTAGETFDLGVDLGSPVATEYHEKAPFPLNGVIRDVAIRYGSNQTPSPVPSVNPTTACLTNLSARGFVPAGGGLYSGFIARGTGTKRLLLRAAGPGLAAFGLATGLPDPKLELSAPAVSGPLLSNDNWLAADSAAIAAVGAFPFATGSRDAALTAALTVPGRTNYTVSVTATSPTAAGLVLAEIFDADGPGAPVRLINGSTLGFVGPAENALFAGFVIAGTGTKRLLVRAVGPGLAGFGVPGLLADPQLAVHALDAASALASNNDWAGTAELKAAATAAGAFTIPDAGRDAAVLVTLPPGTYSVLVTGVGNTTGNALVELYDLDP